jgi:ferredoxin
MVECMVVVDPKKCDFCGTCVAVCPVAAVEVLESLVTIDERVCTQCLNCVSACPWGALEDA